MSTTTDTTRRPARCQAEGKASSKIKVTAEPAGVIDMLTPPSPHHPCVHSLRGSWRPFLLSFNLTFPANGQPGVNSTALIATRQSPTGSVRTTEKERERERKKREWEGEITPPFLAVPASCLVRNDAFAPSASSSIPRSTRFLGYILLLGYPTTLSNHDTIGMLISTLRSRFLISR